MKATIQSTLLLALWLTASALLAQNSLDDVALKYAHDSWDELIEMYSIPNVSLNHADLEKNIQWCEQAFPARGFKTERLETSGPIPLLLATREYPDAEKTVLIYLQLDGQPVDRTKWDQKDPFIPTLKKAKGKHDWETIPIESLKGEIDRDWRIFVRTASDAKGPVMMMLKAMDILNDRSHQANYNIKVIMDFEEELGSPRLPGAVITHKEKLAADMLLIFDGPRHLSNQPTLSYGARGIATLTLKVFGPRDPVHSGNYGNYVPNPAARLTQLLSTLWTDDGRVTIPGWYDGITISDDVQEILEQVPDDEVEIRKGFGIKGRDDIGRTFQEAMQYPSLSILGMQSAWTGAYTRTIIPADATAEMNIRLVKETDGNHMISLVRDHIAAQGYHITDGDPTDEERAKYDKIISFRSSFSYGAFRTDFDTEVGRWLRRGMNRAFGHDPIQIRTAGGSIPISPFVITLGIPAVAVPTVNPDNNQHSPNENLRIGNYIDGIKTIAAILMEDI